VSDGVGLGQTWHGDRRAHRLLLLQAVKQWHGGRSRAATGHRGLLLFLLLHGEVAPRVHRRQPGG